MKTRLYKHMFLAGLLVGAILLPACSTTSVNTVERAVPVAPRQIIADKRVVADGSLQRKVGVLGVSESEAPGGYLKAQVEVLNTTRRLQSFSCRWEWFDERGIIINAVTSTAIPQKIEGKESLFLTAVAPTAAAKDFRLKLMETTTH